MTGIEGTLKNISIVLVEPQGAGNIGSVARAMKNTGFSSLLMVNPVEFRNNAAYSMACKASDILLSANLFNNIDSALAESEFIVGTTRRKGRCRFPLLSLEEAVPLIASAAAGNRVSILFGREDKGLKTQYLQGCNILLEIHTDHLLPSINLSHAVFLVCYNIYRCLSPSQPSFELASRSEVSEMFRHIEGTLTQLGYTEKGGGYLLKSILRNLRRLLGRTGLMPREVKMLRGICTRVADRTKKV